jgi:hypothetical protein
LPGVGRVRKAPSASHERRRAKPGERGCAAHASTTRARTIAWRPARCDS